MSTDDYTDLGIEIVRRYVEAFGFDLRLTVRLILSVSSSYRALHESRWKTAVVAAVDLPPIGPPQSTPTNGMIGRTGVT
jgi:hypothetical protein